ncbi:MAG: hypothetical protein M3Q70_02815 [bacterium]|nr:hypothetical protein [bacterium]
MSVICPTVTAYDLHEYRAQIEAVEKFAKQIHIDLMDGVLAPTLSPSLDEIWLPDNLVSDIHLMYQDIMNVIDRLVELKPNMVIVHAETHQQNDLPLFATKMREAGIKTGLALLPQTTVDEISYLLPHFQQVLVFSGNLGHHGGVANLELLSKITELKKANRWIEIAWDGGIHDQNALQLVDGGVEVLNVGGFIQGADNPQSNFETLNELLNNS